jgi:small subunit ribosomal protein S5
MKNRKFKQVKEFTEAVLQIDRVTRVVKGGRRLRFRATVCIGNMKGKVGVGIGKSTEVTGAIQKAVSEAKKNMVDALMDGTTVPHDIQVKYKSAKIRILPASKGTGLIAGGAIRKVLELAGYKDVLTKSLGSNNKINTSKGTIEAISLFQVTPRMEKANKTIGTKKETAKKPVAKKAPAKPAAKKAAAKPAAKKTAAKKPVAKKAPAKKAAEKKES